MTRTVHAADLFCGAGGTSTGLARACRSLGLELDLLGVNHWKVAIETHTRNHPWARHICQRVEALSPREAVPGGRLDLLVASPECTFHSVARGGRPINDQLRASPWHLLPWLQELVVDSVLIENVPEFQNWGPLTVKGTPMKQQTGETFKAWVGAIRSLGYNVDWKVLNAADYGDATSRRRFFLQARRGRTPVVWPVPSHSRGGRMPGTKRWRAAREVIDWSLKGESIFGRKRPLAPKTIERILEGLRRFGGPQLQPFLVGAGGPSGAGSTRSLDEPMPTVLKENHHALVEPFIVPNFGERPGQAPRTHSVDEPLPAPTSHGAGALVEPFLLPLEGVYGGNAPRGLGDPLPTITQRGGGSLVEPYLVQYNGMSGAHPVSQPVPALTTHDRLGLVMPVVDGYTLDIRFRMLQPHELARAMGFDGYEFTGSRTEVVKQIGNAVATHIAEALCRSLLAPTRRRTLD